MSNEKTLNERPLLLKGVVIHSLSIPSFLYLLKGICWVDSRGYHSSRPSECCLSIQWDDDKCNLSHFICRLLYCFDKLCVCDGLRNVQISHLPGPPLCCCNYSNKRGFHKNDMKSLLLCQKGALYCKCCHYWKWPRLTDPKQFNR